jgi:hypothetical protein
LVEALEAIGEEFDKVLHTINLTPQFPFEYLREQDLENHKLAEALEAIGEVRLLLHPQFNLTPCFPFKYLRELRFGVSQVG